MGKLMDFKPFFVFENYCKFRINAQRSAVIDVSDKVLSKIYI